MSELILASGSPRRREILTAMGVPFTVFCVDTDESCALTSPQEYVRELARRKGQAAYDTLVSEKSPLLTERTVILTADTVVAADGQILGKPQDQEDARRMLGLLSGREHSVLTGIGITVGGVTHTDVCQTFVSVDRIPEEELERYLACGEYRDKAGAYGIQGRFSRWVKGIRGCYFNVVGLPVHTLNTLYRSCTGEALPLT